MSELVQRAMRFAKEIHQRIDHRRKYSNQPYSVHLAQVSKIVASVTDDQEMIASAWLHDVVEDTPATLDDTENELGSIIAQMVRELTDISKPSDGNREVRKSIDREHLSKASGRAQTIKLEDLIDDCKGITLHDARFSRVFLDEMGALLEVLTKADKGLLIINQPELLLEFGFTSKSAARKTLKQFQSLRNNLAHAQDISTYDWAQIARISAQMLE